MVIIKKGNCHIFGGKLPPICVNEGGSCYHLSAVDGPIYIKPVRGNLLSFLRLFHPVLVPFNKVSLGCSLELTADCIRDVMLHFSLTSFHRALSPSRSPLHFHVRSATTPLSLTSTKANCSSVFLALFHPSVFSLFLSVSLCPFHNNENHLFCLF